MTTDKKLAIVLRRIECATLDEVASEFKYSKQAIYQFLRSLSSEARPRGVRVNPDVWVRPELADWLDVHRKSVVWIAREIGVTSQSIRRWFMYGGNIPKWRNKEMLSISAITGIPVERLVKVKKDTDLRKEA